MQCLLMLPHTANSVGYDWLSRQFAKLVLAKSCIVGYFSLIVTLTILSPWLMLLATL